MNTEYNGARPPAGIKARDGKLWFLTQQGVVVSDPNVIPLNPQPPSVIIESIKIDNQKVGNPLNATRNPDSVIKLLPEQNGLEITYTGLSLIKCEQTRFRSHEQIAESKKREFEPWASDMRRSAALPNVACKISDILRDSDGAIEVSVIAPYIGRLLKMFGDDFPVVMRFWKLSRISHEFRRKFSAVSRRRTK